MTCAFDSPDLLDQLESASFEQIDEMPFGLIVMDRDGVVTWYSKVESAQTGIAPEKVLGRNFFESVGPCTNNYLVSQRFMDEPDLDDTIEFVFTLRMNPTPVRLRMLAREGSERQYLAVLKHP